MERGSLCPRWLLHPHANERVLWAYLTETVRVETAGKPAASIYSPGFYGEGSSEWQSFKVGCAKKTDPLVGREVFSLGWS